MTTDTSRETGGSGRTIDAGEGSLTTRTVEAVAAETGRDPTDLPPLYDVVDTDALEALFSDLDDAPREHGYVRFRYLDVEVTVHADGAITVVSLDEPN